MISIERDRATAGAGIFLGDFQDAIEAEGRLYPPDPTSRRECTLGASIACNASGARSFAYGPTRPYRAEWRALPQCAANFSFSTSREVVPRTVVPRLRDPRRIPVHGRALGASDLLIAIAQASTT